MPRVLFIKASRRLESFISSTEELASERSASNTFSFFVNSPELLLEINRLIAILPGSFWYSAKYENFGKYFRRYFSEKVSSLSFGNASSNHSLKDCSASDKTESWLSCVRMSEMESSLVICALSGSPNAKSVVFFVKSFSKFGSKDHERWLS